jgi:hypothetical protein
MKTKDKKDLKISKGIVVICIADGCDDKAIDNGYCWEHYKEFIKEINDE